MDFSFDIVTVIFLIIAVVLFLRLRNILGRRTGHERPPFNPLNTKEGDAFGKQLEQDNVIPMTQDAAASEQRGGDGEEDPLADYAEPGSKLAKDLQMLAEHDSRFTPKNFLDGAGIAYEMIVSTYAKGELKTLKELLGENVFQDFSSALSAREERGESVDMDFVGIESKAILAVSFYGAQANITVQFVSKLISVTRKPDGEIVDGDPAQIREVTDIWTFERDGTSRDPNWRLVATEAAH